jgi:hypothetical protein
MIGIMFLLSPAKKKNGRMVLESELQFSCLTLSSAGITGMHHHTKMHLFLRVQ